jgi:uncharacterized protein (DUF2141 family)
MKTRLLVAVFCMFFPAFSAQGQGVTYTVSGKIIFDKKGDIYVYLVTEDDFNTPFTGIQSLVLTTTLQVSKKREVLFSFEQVEAGKYGIRCFQDVNGNGKLDRGLAGPKEPWGMSWQGDKPGKWPGFSHIEFDVKEDIHDVVIELAL